MFYKFSSCRNQVESCSVEKEKLLENANNVMNEKSALIRESEESTRQLEHQYEIKIKYVVFIRCDFSWIFFSEKNITDQSRT